MAKTNYSPTFPMFPGDAAVVTTSDTVNFLEPSVVFAGSAGNIRILTAQGSDVTFTNVQAGAILPVQAIRVFASSTTAISILRIGGGSVGAAPPPVGNFAVLPAAGTPTYTVTRNVLSSSGAVFAVPATVLSSGGTSYTPI